MKLAEGMLGDSPIFYADFKHLFILEVDVSHNGIGVVLYQEQEGKVSLSPNQREICPIIVL